LPILACTANALPGEADKCLAAGMDDYVAKPLDLPTLKGRVERWLSARKPAPPLDREVLANASQGTLAMEGEILAQFSLHARADMEALRAAAAVRRLRDVAQGAHRVKGSSLAVGANGLAAAAECVEQAGRAGDLGLLDGALADMEREWERLEAHLASPGSA
jgi:HPt (histidine-containing phosphotransfer) domain-containing protein